MSDRDQQQDFCVRLVEAVEKHPCLYNHELPDYSNKNMVEKAWEMVGQDVNSNVLKCKEKWRNIRTVFGRHLKAVPSSDKRKKSYYLYDMLQFVLPFMQSSVMQISGNFPPVIKDENESAPQSDDYDHDDGDGNIQQFNPQLISVESLAETQPATSSAYSQPTPSVPTVKPIPKRAKLKRRYRETSAANEDFTQLCNQQNTPAAESPRKHFLLSLLPDVQSMTPEQFRLFRRRIILLIDEILEPSGSDQDI